MISKQLFFQEYKKKLDKNLTQKEVESVDKFLDSINNNFDFFNVLEWAYVLATVLHETAGTYEPVIEAYWKSEEWRKRNFRYYPYYGRGFVQLTWDYNYKTFSKLLKKDLVNNPELACDYNIAFEVMMYGFKNGVFTGKKLSDYEGSKYTDYMKFVNMRRIINGTDKAELIADYAQEFYRILKISVNN